MMGKDIESMLQNLNNVKIETKVVINIINSSMNTGVKDTLNTCLDELIDQLSNIVSDCGKMEKIESSLYVDKKEFNNSIGSPWKEYEELVDTSTNVVNYIRDHSLDSDELIYLSILLNTLLSDLVDTKWALINYHDYIQRGFDNLFNDNNPSITFTDGLKGHQTTGNVEQSISNNVSVKGKSLNPY